MYLHWPNQMHLNVVADVIRQSMWKLGVLAWKYDEVIKWKHFPRNWPFVRGFHRSPVNSPHKGQWRGALMFSLICVWINGWVNNREAGDLRRYRAHYDVTVMFQLCSGITFKHATIYPRHFRLSKKMHARTPRYPTCWFFSGLVSYPRLIEVSDRHM